MEFDDRDWTRREWIKINEIFHVFLVENTLLWAPRTRQKLLPDCDKLPSLTSGSQEIFYWPALVSFTISFHQVHHNRLVGIGM